MGTQLDPGPPAGSRPTGMVTFLFSDIEGSTVRWERDREAMAVALGRHDALVRAALEARGAYVFKTMGDAFCTAFATPHDAVAAALDAQRALAAEDFSAVDGLRVRMALHAGTADERDGDYFGPTVNRVARLLSVGHGGQVLLSGSCLELVGGALPPGCSLRDHGDHRLKDLSQPERIHQLLAPDLITDFPPLRSLEHLSNNLPAPVSSFVGRESEIAEITALVERHRLVSLVGPGGVGKTRLSLHVAADRIDAFHDGVWFIELAPLGKGEYIPTAIASALGIKLPNEGDPFAHLALALKGKEILLVLDNCEHLVEPAARAISALLRTAPKLKVLASSRQALGVAGEATYRVPTLDLSSGVALFAERARAATPAFVLSSENAPVVAEICKRLDGIALAIELAAARVKVLGVKALHERLDERFRILTGGGRDLLPRQQTLRELIDWSHDLLDERERALFRRLAIFVNGFTLEGAVAVGSSHDIDELDVFDVLASLVDKSLVLAELQGDSMRYRLLESMRAYALEKLDGRSGVGLDAPLGTERDCVAERHVTYLSDRFAAILDELGRTARFSEFDAALRGELEDVRSALDSAWARADVADGAALLANIGAGWQTLGLASEGIERCEGYLARLSDDRFLLRARLLVSLEYLLSSSGWLERGFERVTEAVPLARASGDVRILSTALVRYAYVAAKLHRFDDAERSLAEAEAYPQASPKFRIDLLQCRANLSMLRGDLEAAARAQEELRTLAHTLANVRSQHLAAWNLAEIEHQRGLTERAAAIALETLPALRSGSDTNMLAMFLANLAAYLVAMGDVSGALAAARESIDVQAVREPGRVHVALAIEHLALALALGGDATRAAQLEGYAQASFVRLGFVREFTETTTNERLIGLLRRSLASDELARLIAEGAGLAPEAAITLATTASLRQGDV